MPDVSYIRFGGTEGDATAPSDLANPSRVWAFTSGARNSLSTPLDGTASLKSVSPYSVGGVATTSQLSAFNFGTGAWRLRLRYKAASAVDGGLFFFHMATTGDPDGNNTLVDVWSAGSTTIVATIQDAAGAIVQTTPNQFDNAKHEIALSFDGSGNVYLHFDGVYLGGTTTTHSFGSIPATRVAWGCDGSNANRIGGYLDELIIQSGVSYGATNYTPIAGELPGYDGITLSAVQGTGSVGTVVPAVSKALTGNSGTGSVGTVKATTTKALTAVSGTGSVGTVAASRSKALSGNSSTGSVGTVSPSVTVGLSGVSSTGSVGTVTPGTDPGLVLTGNTSTGSVGSTSANVSIGLSGVTGTGSVGSVTASAGASQALTGVGGTGTVGQPGVNVTVALMGIGAAGFVGSVSTGAAATVTAGGYGKKKPQPRRQWMPEKAQIQQDSDIVQLLERQLRPELDDEDEEFLLLMS